HPITAGTTAIIIPAPATTFTTAGAIAIPGTPSTGATGKRGANIGATGGRTGPITAARDETIGATGGATGAMTIAATATGAAIAAEQVGAAFPDRRQALGAAHEPGAVQQAVRRAFAVHRPGDRYEAGDPVGL